MATLLIQTLATASVHRHRLVAALVFAGTSALLGTAMWLRPADAGLGTHTQMGMPSCSILTMTGKPCPSCGMTTAFTHMMHAQPIAAFTVQPAGALLCLVAIAAAILSGYVLITGRNIWPRIRPWVGPRAWLVLAGVLIGGWLYKLNTL